MSDVKISPKNSNTRKYNFVLFDINVKVEGIDAALINLNNLDLQVDLYAKVTTKTKAM